MFSETPVGIVNKKTGKEIFYHTQRSLRRVYKQVGREKFLSRLSEIELITTEEGVAYIKRVKENRA